MCILLNHSQSITDLHKPVLWYHERDYSIRSCCSSVAAALFWGANLGSCVSLVSCRECWLSPRRPCVWLQIAVGLEEKRIWSVVQKAILSNWSTVNACSAVFQYHFWRLGVIWWGLYRVSPGRSSSVEAWGCLCSGGSAAGAAGSDSSVQYTSPWEAGQAVLRKITEPKTSEVGLSTFIAKEINTHQSLGSTAILCGLFFFKGITRNIKILPKHDWLEWQREMCQMSDTPEDREVLISWLLFPLQIQPCLPVGRTGVVLDPSWTVTFVSRLPNPNTFLMLLPWPGTVGCW